ncbi:hypothetical protein HK099_007294 [Clydaea vesicula]|uniref:Uncharacterized protein n=1 Tax=Clydaea vesicula TaxID=447962 RepID=A0AAD5TX15_9FUNG|nr:hypothetical protein HK099_007294 [Clydaea vesicula]
MGRTVNIKHKNLQKERRVSRHSFKSGARKTTIDLVNQANQDLGVHVQGGITVFQTETKSGKIKLHGIRAAKMGKNVLKLNNPGMMQVIDDWDFNLKSEISKKKCKLIMRNIMLERKKNEKLNGISKEVEMEDVKDETNEEVPKQMDLISSGKGTTLGGPKNLK